MTWSCKDYQVLDTDLVLRGVCRCEGQGNPSRHQVADTKTLQDARDAVFVQPDPPTQGVEDDAQYKQLDGTLPRKELLFILISG